MAEYLWLFVHRRRALLRQERPLQTRKFQAHHRDERRIPFLPIFLYYKVTAATILTLRCPNKLTAAYSRTLSAGFNCVFFFRPLMILSAHSSDCSNLGRTKNTLLDRRKKLMLALTVYGSNSCGVCEITHSRSLSKADTGMGAAIPAVRKVSCSKVRMMTSGVLAERSWSGKSKEKKNFGHPQRWANH